LFYNQQVAFVTRLKATKWGISVIKVWAGNILTVAAIKVAHRLRGLPGCLERFQSIARKYIDWRGHVVVCETEFGARFPCSLRDIIQRKIAYFGVWEPNLTAYCKRVLRPGDVLVDVGANIGYFTLLGSSLVGTSGKVVAIEASPRIFALLSSNIARNAATNVRAVNKAAAYAAGQVAVFAAPSDNIGHTSTIPAEGNIFENFVDAESLQYILFGDEMTRTRLLKIDIEGAEGPVVKSFLENIALYGPHCELAIEVSPECGWIVEKMASVKFFAYRMPNDYSDRDYLRPSPKRPARHSGPVMEQCDFIFSRVDAEHL
jgi:FkbM family methyltransferase